MEQAPRKPEVIFLFLTIVAGIVALAPYHNFQNVLSQGDHGHNLYCFVKTAQGALPYRDYYWPYGPLMPYYYAFFLKLFGVSIQSVLLGKVVLNFMAGIFFYFAIRALFSPALGFAAALWFWTHKPDFFFTYNHIGGIVMLPAIICFLFLYIKEPQRRYVLGGIFFVFLLALVKINFGLSSLIAFLLSVLIIDSVSKNPGAKKNRIFYAVFSTIILSALTAVYYLLTRHLSSHEFRQYFPYFGYWGPQLLSSAARSLVMLTQLWVMNLRTSFVDHLFGAVIILCAVQTFYLFIKNKLRQETRHHLFLAIVTTAIFYMATAHEFLIGGPILYRTGWMEPLKFIVIFIFLGTAMRYSSKTVRFSLWALVLLIGGLQIQGIYQAARINKTPEHYFSCGKTAVYIKNSPQWIRTVEQTTDYLNANLKTGELFLAFPYDPLYYFLTGKDSPVTEIMFFPVKGDQEKKIISRLEEKRVNLILLSNRINTREPGIGGFGGNYCPLLAEYFYKYFDVVATFGEWDKEGNWAWNHGVKILKRKKITDVVNPI